MKPNSNRSRTLYIRLDAHKEKTSIAILESHRDDEPRIYAEMITSQHALERTMRRIAKAQDRTLADLHVIYEASGCGFGIARRLLQVGVRCEVIAPFTHPHQATRQAPNRQ